MSFHFRDQPFWGLLVVAPSRDIIAEPVSPAIFRPRLVARWHRGADGQLVRRWHREMIRSAD